MIVVIAGESHILTIHTIRPRGGVNSAFGNACLPERLSSVTAGFDNRFSESTLRIHKDLASISFPRSVPHGKPVIPEFKTIKVTLGDWTQHKILRVLSRQLDEVAIDLKNKLSFLVDERTVWPCEWVWNVKLIFCEIDSLANFSKTDFRILYSDCADRERLHKITECYNLFIRPPCHLCGHNRITPRIAEEPAIQRLRADASVEGRLDWRVNANANFVRNPGCDHL